MPARAKGPPVVACVSCGDAYRNWGCSYCGEFPREPHCWVCHCEIVHGEIPRVTDGRQGGIPVGTVFHWGDGTPDYMWDGPWSRFVRPLEDEEDP